MAASKRFPLREGREPETAGKKTPWKGFTTIVGLIDSMIATRAGSLGLPANRTKDRLSGHPHIEAAVSWK